MFFYFIVVTIYATLGDEAIVYGFNEVESTIVMTDAALMPKLKNLGSQLRFIKTIIYFGDTKKSLISEFPEGLGIYSLQQVKDLGSKIKNCMCQQVFLQKFFLVINQKKIKINKIEMKRWTTGHKIFCWQFANLSWHIFLCFFNMVTQ